MPTSAAPPRACPRPVRRWFHDGAVNCAELSPDNRYAITASAEKTARIWHVETGNPALPPIEHRMSVILARFSPDGNHVFTLEHNKRAHVWEAQTGSLLYSRVKGANKQDLLRPPRLIQSKRRPGGHGRFL